MTDSATPIETIVAQRKAKRASEAFFRAARGRVAAPAPTTGEDNRPLVEKDIEYTRKNWKRAYVAVQNSIENGLLLDQAGKPIPANRVSNNGTTYTASEQINNLSRAAALMLQEKHPEEWAELVALFPKAAYRDDRQALREEGLTF